MPEQAAGQISSGSGASGMGASSSSSDASAISMPPGLRERALVPSVSRTSRQSSFAFSSLAEIVVAACAQATPPRRSVAELHVGRAS